MQAQGVSKPGDDGAGEWARITKPVRGLPAQLRVAMVAWGVLAYNLLVIVWGAYVRASGSGAGCGRHWPLCNGEVLPRSRGMQQLVELSHRATSGLAMLGVFGLAIAVHRVVPRGHRARRASLWSSALMVGEALVGAGLVLFELVAHDASAKRALSIVLHLGNTFLLLAALCITAWTLRHEPALPEGAHAPKESANVSRSMRSASSRSSHARGSGAAWLLGTTLVAVLLVGASGALAALGDTLFPARSLAEGFAAEMSPLAHGLLRLRIVHPFVALPTAALVFASASYVRMTSEAPRARWLAGAVTVAFGLQFALGITNVMLLAPIGIQLLHLFMAELVWILLVLMTWERLRGYR